MADQRSSGKPRFVTPDRPPQAVARRPDRTALAVGIGLAATGIGAVIGLAAERATVARMLRGDAGDGDGRGGPVPGSLRGRPLVVHSGGADLHVEVDEPEQPTAGAPTVVLSHGYALSLDAWHYQRLALRGQHRLVLWDQRGHGQSEPGPAGTATIEQIARDLGAVIDAVAPEGPLVLLGHSMGGMTVMALAGQRPELFTTRVVGTGLFCTSSGGLGDLDLGLPGVGRMLMSLAPPTARMLAGRPGLVAQTRRLGSDLEGLLVRRYSFASPVPGQVARFSTGMIARTPMGVISDFLPALAGHDQRAALGRLAGRPLLVMAADDDLLIPRSHSDEIVAALPDAEYVVVRDAGHLLPLEHPEVVGQHLGELLADATQLARRRAPGRRRGWGRRTVTPVRERRRADRACAGHSTGQPTGGAGGDDR